MKKIGIYLITLLLLAAVLLCTTLEWEDQPPLSFQAGEETIRVWEENGAAYVFLPSYVDLKNVTVQTAQPLHLDDLLLKNGRDCGGLELGRAYETADGGTLTVLKSENLPALYLDTVSGNMDYIHKKKGNRESGAMRLYDETGRLTAAGALKKIQARGNSTFVPEKKPYSLTLSRQADLLGMGAAKNWILLANEMDPSHLKNKFVYDFAAEAGLPYSPESRWVDVYLNGNYAGLYLLCERNEIAQNRVELPKNQGFLVSKEQLFNLEQGDAPYFETDAGAFLRVRKNTLGQTQMERIFQRAENAILAPDGLDPETGRHWQDLIDLDSWAGKYLVEEIFGGIDAGIASQYFFYAPGEDRLYAGPVWDFDETMGVDIWLGGELFLEQVPEMYFAHRARETPWYHSLYGQEAFFSRMTELYRQNYSELLAVYLQERLPAYEAQIRQAAQLNRIRWKSRDPGEMADYLSWYVSRRMAFLNAAWIENRKFIPVHVDFSYEEFMCKYAVFDYAVSPGGFLPRLAVPEGYRWYFAGTDTPFDPGRPILEETSVELHPVGG